MNPATKQPAQREIANTIIALSLLSAHQACEASDDALREIRRYAMAAETHYQCHQYLSLALIGNTYQDNEELKQNSINHWKLGVLSARRQWRLTKDEFSDELSEYSSYNEKIMAELNLSGDYFAGAQFVEITEKAGKKVRAACIQDLCGLDSQAESAMYLYNSENCELLL